MSTVYRHIRHDTNQPFYIGIGFNTRRAYNKSMRNKRWKEVVSQTDYSVEILFEDCPDSFCCVKERELIALYKREAEGGTLVNITDGGRARGYKTRALTSEQRIHLSAINAGQGHPLWGKAPSEETRKKISASLTGKPIDRARIEKANLKRRGRPAHNRKSVFAYEAQTNNLVGEYASLSIAAKALGVDVSNISNVLKGKLKQTKGFRFE